MGKKFKQLIRLNSDDLILYFSVVGGVFLLIHLITACVLFFGDVGSSPMVSGVVLPIVAGFMAVIATISHVGVAFTDALRVGQTRKSALALTLGLSFCMWRTCPSTGGGPFSSPLAVCCWG